MLRRPRENLVLLFVGLDLLLTLAALYLATRIRLFLPFGQPLGPENVDLHPVLYGLVAVIWLFGFSSLSTYRRSGATRLPEEIGRVILSILASTLILAGSLYLSFRDVSRLLFVYFFLIDMVFMLGYRIALLAVARRVGVMQRPTRMLIIGAGRTGQELVRMMREERTPDLQAVGFVDNESEVGLDVEGLPILGRLDEGPRIAQKHEVDEVIVALPLRAHRELLNTVAQFEKLPVSIRVVPDLLDLAFFKATVEDFQGIPLIGLRDPLLNPAQRVVKRAFDLVVSALLFLLLWPVMLIMALLIKLDSQGPALLRQPRAGENGRVFQMYKFRSMVEDAERDHGGVILPMDVGEILHKRPDDPRVTRVGRHLRRYSLDELPQLLNVLKGEMSLVGPRPELPWLVDRYEPWQWKRFAVPQGITGWWQVTGRGDRPMHLHTQDDLWYIQNYSLFLDIKILLRTIGAVLARRGAF